MNGAITREGTAAENRFCHITGATKAGKSRDGDVVFEGHLVEVKALNKRTSWVVNQLRPVKYLPTAIYHAPWEQWYVIPAHCLVLRASRLVRGQHTSIPYECMNWDICGSEFKVQQSDLVQKMREAIHESDVTYAALKDSMSAARRDAETLAMEIHLRIRPLLKSLDVSYPERPTVPTPEGFWDEIVVASKATD